MKKLQLQLDNFDSLLFRFYREICNGGVGVSFMSELIPELAKSYLEIHDIAAKTREFFGLRDFYR